MLCPCCSLPLSTLPPSVSLLRLAALRPHRLAGAALGLALLRTRLRLGFSEFCAHFYTGEFKIICYTTNFKNPDYPDYPTLEELGYEARGIPFQGLCIKAGADPDVVAKLNAAIDKILADESVIEQLKAADSWVEGTCYGGEEFAQTVKNAYDYYDELLVSTGLIDELSS